jgi:hypothetical protein
LLMISLALSMAEIYTSIRALNIQLGDMTGKETEDLRRGT